MTYRIVAENGERLDIVEQFEVEKNATWFLRAVSKQQRGRPHPVRYRIIYMGPAWAEWAENPKRVAEARRIAVLRISTTKIQAEVSGLLERLLRKIGLSI